MGKYDTQAQNPRSEADKRAACIANVNEVKPESYDRAKDDIAGTAWSKKDAATCPKGATAFGVRLLDALVAARYEEK